MRFDELSPDKQRIFLRMYQKNQNAKINGQEVEMTDILLRYVCMGCKRVVNRKILKNDIKNVKKIVPCFCGSKMMVRGIGNNLLQKRMNMKNISIIDFLLGDE